jgi:hypothetical protein
MLHFNKLLAACCILVAAVAAQAEPITADVLRASEEKIQSLLQEIKTLKAEVEAPASTANPNFVRNLLDQAAAPMHRPPECDDDNGPGPGNPPSCVRKCNSRYSDGTCASYGQDYCAPRAVCVPKCNSRYSDGTCASYGADLCGSGRFTCVVKCNSRYSDGTCASYGDDHCGPRATCLVNCTARYSDGTCASYGPDICH